jgi:hypothetical protein
MPMLHKLEQAGEVLFALAVIQDKRKRPSGRRRRAFADGKLKRNFVRGRFGSRCGRGCFCFRAAEPPNGVPTHAPGDNGIARIGLLGLAVLALELRADELSVYEDIGMK